MDEMRHEYKILTEIPKQKGPLGSVDSKWEDNIKIELRKRGGGIVDLTQLSQGRM
jgi:hypothetical protein